MNRDNFLVRPHLRAGRDGSASAERVGDAVGRRPRRRSPTGWRSCPTSSTPSTRTPSASTCCCSTPSSRCCASEPFERAAPQGRCRSPALLEDQQTIPAIAAAARTHPGRPGRRVVGRRHLPDARRGPPASCAAGAADRAVEEEGVIYSDFERQHRRGRRGRAARHRRAVGSSEFIQFRKKAEHFLKQHLGDDAVAKVRSGEPLTADDIAELQRILVAAGIGNDGRSPKPARRPAASGCSSARSSASTGRRPRRRSPSSSTTSATRANQIRVRQPHHRRAHRPRRRRAQPGLRRPLRRPRAAGPEDLFTEDDLDRLFQTLERLGPADTDG